MRIAFMGERAEDAELVRRVLAPRGHVVDRDPGASRVDGGAVSREAGSESEPAAWLFADGADVRRAVAEAPSLAGGARPVVIALVDDPTAIERALRDGADDVFVRTYPDAWLAARVAPYERLVELRAALAEAEGNFHALLEASPDPIAIHREGKMTYANTAAVKAFRAPSAAAFLAREVYAYIDASDEPEVRARLREVEREGRIAPLREERFRGWDGSLLFGEAYSCPIVVDGERSVLTVGRDLTEPRRLESMLRHAERLAMLGTMAASIAHELRNPLTFVLCNLADLAQRLPDLGERVQPDTVRGLEDRLEAAMEGGERLRQLTEDLTRFARSTDEHLTTVDLRGVVDGALRVARPELAGIVVRTEWSEVPNVRGNELRLGQVFLNLFVNAAQAVHARGQGERSISVHGFRDDEGFAVVDVDDAGIGLSHAVLPHLFEPFFTTKREGLGTGLGLSVSRGIVRELGGDIEASSSPLGGARFRVRLPPSGDG